MLEGMEDDEDPYKAFQEKYRSDLAGFTRDCIDWKDKDGFTEYQDEAARRLVESRRFSMRGPHGLGKTAFAAITVLWFSLTRDGEDWKVATLASAWRQLTKFLWPEVHKWSRRVKWDVVGRPPLIDGKELLTMSIKLSSGEAFALASDNHEFIEGAHADNLLYVFDESKAIPDATWDAAEGAMSVGDVYWLAISTPSAPMGRFYDIHARKAGYLDWSVLHVTLEMAVNAGRVSQEWADKRRQQWGEKSSIYLNRVLGMFAADDADTVITLAMVERSVERWQALNDAGQFGMMDSVGADIGRGGDDTAQAYKHGDAISGIEYFHDTDVMQVAGRLSSKMQKNHNLTAVIDVIGIGAGVVDRLRELGPIADRVHAFVASGRSNMVDKTGELGFINMRSAGWWNLRELLMDDEIALPPDDRLIGELTAPRYVYKSGGKIQVESKESVKKRIGRSTDAADAVIMVFMEQFVTEDLSGLGHVEGYTNRWS